MSFKDIKGQDKTIAILRKAIEDESVSQAYLFSGPAGIGKKQVALEFAAALNCQQGRADPCGKCSSCLKIKNSQHPDVRVIDADILVDISNEQEKNAKALTNAIKIGHVRQLEKMISLRAYEGVKKVSIIDEAHNLTPSASNALLKTLEEPPRDSVIILVSSKPALLFKTIISRCQVLRFYPLPRKELELLLKGNYGLDSSQAHFLSYFCDGRLGDALRLEDLGFYQEKNKVIDEFALRQRAGIWESSLPETREGLRRDVNILMSWFRDLYLLKTGMPENEVINFDRRRELARTADSYSIAELNNTFDFLSDALLRVEQNVNVKLLFSSLKVELCKRQYR